MMMVRPAAAAAATFLAHTHTVAHIVVGFEVDHIMQARLPGNLNPE
jgi:hypothetical protein